MDRRENVEEFRRIARQWGGVPEARWGLPHAHSTLRRPNRTFTLVELLVVVAIMSILSALLLPQLSKAISATRSASCLNIERQLAVGISQFTEDHYGVFPSYAGDNIAKAREGSVTYGRWFINLGPYMGSQNTPDPFSLSAWYAGMTAGLLAEKWFRCPETVSANSTVGGDWLAYNAYMGFVRACTAYMQSYYSVRRAQCVKPSNTFLFADHQSNDPDRFYYVTSLIPGSSAPVDISHHGNSANYVFIDGHGKAINELDIIPFQTENSNTTSDYFSFPKRRQ